MIDTWFIHAHAIVSADDRIAAADGTVPAALRNEADWARFQAALDAAAVTVLGRRGHAANPNDKRRNRLVLSSSARGIERREDAWWWNPAATPLAEALARAAPGGGTVAVVGGRRVFDLFLSTGFDRFDLARAGDVRLPDGIPIFSALATGASADAVLAAHGLVAGPTQMLDPPANVSLVVWRHDAGADIAPRNR
jgi:dihydrofolate reductase